MPKTREQKEKLIEEIKNSLEKAKGVVFVDYKGLSVKDTEILRKSLQKSGVTYAVTKNSLFKIALNQSNIKIDESIMDRPLAVAFGYEDEVSAAKGIANFAKTNESLEIVGGILEKDYIEQDKVIQLASLPTKDQLYVKFLSVLSAPSRNLVGVMQGNLRGLIYILNAKTQAKA